MKSLQKRRFTLVELMVVIVIIGILATLAFNGYQAYTQNRNKKSTQFALDSIKTAILSYHTDKQVWPYYKKDGKTITIFENGFLTNEDNFLLQTVLSPEQRAVVEKEFTISGKRLKDRWDNDIRIRRSLQTYRDMNPADRSSPAECRNVRNAGSFDLYSLGPDGVEGIGENETCDDIFPSDEG